MRLNSTGNFVRYTKVNGLWATFLSKTKKILYEISVLTIGFRNTDRNEMTTTINFAYS